MRRESISMGVWPQPVVVPDLLWGQRAGFGETTNKRLTLDIKSVSTGFEHIIHVVVGEA